VKGSPSAPNPVYIPDPYPATRNALLRTTGHNPGGMNRMLQQCRPARVAAAAVLVLLAAACTGSITQPEPEERRVLLIGNSLLDTNGTAPLLQALADASGQRLVLRPRIRPGMNLSVHWMDERTRALLEEEQWDFVILQEAAVVSDTGRAVLRDYAGRFRDATSGRVALFAPWAPRDGPHWFPVIHESFMLAAEATGTGLVAAGEAWRTALGRDGTVPVYAGDGVYPSVEGAYLNALILYQYIFGRTAVGLPSELALREGGRVRIESAVALLLQQAAAEAVRFNRP
jgi:hypothetical protein